MATEPDGATEVLAGTAAVVALRAALPTEHVFPPADDRGNFTASTAPGPRVHHHGAPRVAGEPRDHEPSTKHSTFSGGGSC